MLCLTNLEQKMIEILESIPSFSFLIVVPYLDSQDALSLRLVNSTIKELVEEESEILWTHFVSKDFGLSDATRTLLVEPRGRGPSVFGTNGRNAVINTRSAFECWKQWKRANLRFFGSSKRNLNASFFLRAAIFWEKIENWCMENGEFGLGLIKTLRPGEAHFEWPIALQNTPGFDATQALYSFYSGQALIRRPKIGLLGGWSAYSAVRLTLLSQPRQSPRQRTHIVIATSFPLDGTTYDVNPATGNVEHPVRNPCPRSGFDNVLSWLEEYSRRLTLGEYKVGSLSSELGSFPGITLFPCLPPRASRAVTRGLEVFASSVWSPSDQVFIYSICIKLLRPGDDGYDPNRNFETCQLVSRHWKLTIEGRPEVVDGYGLKGKYPLLREGSYRDDWGPSATKVAPGKDEQGAFSYQSMVQDNCEGYMQGYLTFVPGSIAEPTGNPFDIVIAPFPLDRNPEFMYTY